MSLSGQHLEKKEQSEVVATPASDYFSLLHKLKPLENRSNLSPGFSEIDGAKLTPEPTYFCTSATIIQQFQPSSLPALKNKPVDLNKMWMPPATDYFARKSILERRQNKGVSDSKNVMVSDNDEVTIDEVSEETFKGAIPARSRRI